MSHPLFYSIDDSQFGRYARKKLLRLRESIQLIHDFPPDLSLPETLIDAAYAQGDWDDLVGQIPVNYTLAAAMAYEKHKGFVVEAVIDFIQAGRVGESLIQTGVGGAFRAIDINCDDIRKQSLKALAHESFSTMRWGKDSNSETRWMKGWDDYLISHIGLDTFTDMNMVMLSQFSKNELPAGIFTPLSQALSDLGCASFLTADDPDRAAQFKEVVLPYCADSNEALFRYVIPLCHVTYLSGCSGSTVIKAAEPLVQAIAEWKQVPEKNGMQERFVRRCLAHIAMGFEDLMREVGIGRDDIIPIREESDLWVADNQIASSPLEYAIKQDSASTLAKNCQLLRDHGVEVGINELMEIEKRRNSDCPGPLAWHIRNEDQYSHLDLLKTLNELVAHKDWPGIPRIWTHDEQFAPTAFPDDFQIEILKKNDAGDTVLPEIKYRFYQDQVKNDIAHKMIEQGDMTASIMKTLKVDPVILEGHSKTLSKELKRLLVDDGLGL